MAQLHDAADLNLLVGMLAVQMNLVTRDQLVTAMNACVPDRSKSLGEVLVEQRVIGPQQHALLQALVQQHLKQHQDNPQQSLAAVHSAHSVTKALEQIDDPALQASIVRMFATRAPDDDPFATAYVGSPTSAGQRFRILRPHARGGLGEVFVARDEELHREVALKEIQSRHADDLNSRSRFLLEAEITGGLEHPGVVPVYGLGQYADGRPFYAMRFIRGDSLKDAIEKFHNPRPTAARGDRAGGARERTLQLRKLLGRFIAVCQAIQYAHDRGVLHRDLKPSNIMLGKYGETLVVDWGMAKAVAGPEVPATGREEAPLKPASGSGTAETLPGAAVGTPAFMSPEQAAGRLDLIGPPSDIYSLGATLYCLLTGTPPVADDDVGRVLKKVQEGDYPPARQRKADVDQALEAICVKAMALDPAERYRSPRALADDIEHWLADEPVTAWPEPATVRAGRWMRRHKPLVSGMAAAFLVGVVGLTAGLLWYQDEQNYRANEQALRQAEASRKRALAHAASRQALDQAEHARADLHAVLRKAGGVFELLNRPEDWRAQINIAQAALGRARLHLDQMDEDGVPELSARAARLAAALLQDDADRGLAERLEQIRMDRATVIAGKFDNATAAAEYPKAFAQAGLAVLTDDAGGVAARVSASPIKEQLIAALDTWAYIAYTAGNKNVADQVLATTRKAAPDPQWGDRLRQSSNWSDQAALATLVRDAAPPNIAPQMFVLVGYLLDRSNPLKEAWLRRAQAQYPADFWLNLDLGYTIDATTNSAEAAGFYRAALAVRPRCAVAYNNLGFALINQEKLDEAIAACRKALELDPQFAMAHDNIGWAYFGQKKLPEAIAAYRKAIEIDPKYANAHNNLGWAYYRQKKLPEAIAAFREAIRLDMNFARAHINLGAALGEQKNFPEAIAAFQEAIAIDPKEPRAYGSLMATLRTQVNLFAATEVIDTLEKAIRVEPKIAEAHAALAVALLYNARFPEAAEASQRGLDLLSPRQSSRQLYVNLLKACQRLQALDKRLPVVLDGTVQATPDEVVEMAQMCHQFKHQNPTAVKLYRKAFQARPALVKNQESQRRYDAACAAVLAGMGQGDEAANLPADEKSKLRQQAHAWLQADLDGFVAQMKDEKVEAVVRVTQMLTQWQNNPDLSDVRDAMRLARLPAAEGVNWQKLWAQAGALLSEARTRMTEMRLEGELTEKETSNVHEVKMIAGKIYVLDMESTVFDTFLKLQDAQGKMLAENDDISLENLNSRIVFTPSTDGTYRVLATSYQEAGAGAYTITVREFAAKKN